MQKSLSLRPGNLPFLLRFLFLAMLGFGLLALLAAFFPESPLRSFFQVMHASACALLLDIASPALDITREGAVLYALGSPVVHVTEECDGVESMLLLTAALLAFSPNRRGLLASLTGAGLLFAGNVLRIMLLFHLYRTDGKLADMVHIYIGPLFTILPGLAWFLFIAPRLRRFQDSP